MLPQAAHDALPALTGLSGLSGIVAVNAAPHPALWSLDWEQDINSFYFGYLI